MNRINDEHYSFVICDQEGREIAKKEAASEAAVEVAEDIKEDANRKAFEQPAQTSQADFVGPMPKN